MGKIGPMAFRLKNCDIFKIREQSFYVYPPHSVGLSAEKCGYMSKASLSLGMRLYCFREVLIIFQSFCILLIVGLDVINEIKVACGNQDQAHKKTFYFL